MIVCDCNKRSRLTLGWKAMAVTKSMCWKQHRHSLLDMCHNLTVLSMDDERRKKFWMDADVRKAMESVMR